VASQPRRRQEKESHKSPIKRLDFHSGEGGPPDSTYTYIVNNFLKKSLDFGAFMWYIITMKATKKDFEFTAALLAAAIGGTPPISLVLLASDKFKADNPRFDVNRFKEACGYYDECERIMRRSLANRKKATR
jgi:hypothetical protein